MNNPPIPAAIDLLASYAENGAYIKPDGIKDAITIVLEELNRAAGEIVVLREMVASTQSRPGPIWEAPPQPSELRALSEQIAHLSQQLSNHKLDAQLRAFYSR